MAVTNMQCEKEYLVKNFIRKYGNEPFRVDNCFLHQVVKLPDNSDRKIIVNESFLFSKYKDELVQYLRKRELDDTEYRRYRFNPKLFAYDTYGTTELWFMVLHANELYTVNQFDLHTIYYYDPAFFDAINRAIDLEAPFSAINESEVEEILTADTVFAE